MNSKELLTIIDESLLRFSEISEESWSFKLGENKWSKQEILGHLCDSAFTNIRRLIVTQYEENQKIVYEQDFWVKAQNYQNISTQHIIDLWKALNIQLFHIIENLPKAQLKNTCFTSNFVTLEFLIEDYINHLLHHLDEIKK